MIKMAMIEMGGIERGGLNRRMKMLPGILWVMERRRFMAKI
jgi:hypothetical protein